MLVITAKVFQNRNNSKDSVGFSISEKTTATPSDDEIFWWLMANLLRWHRTHQAHFDLNKRIYIDLFDSRKKQLCFGRTQNQLLKTFFYEGKHYTIKNVE